MSLLLLKSCPLFFELYDAEIEKMVKYCTVYTFEEGDKVISDGEEGDQVFVMLEGHAMVQKETGSEIVKIQPLKAGDVFGEMSLMGEKTRQADIVTTDTSFILEIKYDQIFSLFKEEPKIFGLVLFNLSRLVSRRLAASNQIIIGLQKELREKSA